VLAAFVFLPPERLIQRFARFVSTDGLNSDGRTGLWAETIPLIKAYPFFGCGLGGYETAFSRFKISGVLVTDDFVHNDYLQLLAELGLIGFVIVAVLAFSVVRIAVSGAVKSSDPETCYFGVACLGALSTIALHSFADFNLYIPANAMLLAWIAGMTMSVELRVTETNVRERFEVTNVATGESVEIGAHEEIYG
jgi:O-antigen ligase